MTVAVKTREMPGKFQDPDVTADGEPRGQVAPKKLRTIWFNTGTLCNLTCANCYIESSPRNDRLVYISAAEVSAFLDEADARGETEEVGFTGGEPFMNPEFPAMLEAALSRGYRVLVLTNAMRPMMKQSVDLLRLQESYNHLMHFRISVDHYSKELHEEERGRNTWQKTIEGTQWLCENGFAISAAGRTRWGECESELRAGYRKLFAETGIAIDADDPMQLMLFPEMDPEAQVPEITESCWSKLGLDPSEIMCASSRMVVKRKGAARPVVIACTLIPYDSEFEMGETLEDSWEPVKLNHPHCSKFCVLGGGSCSV